MRGQQGVLQQLKVQAPLGAQPQAPGPQGTEQGPQGMAVVLPGPRVTKQDQQEAL